MFYPSHLIKPNQKTPGNEFALATTPNEEYIGSYFVTHDGKYFTGKNSFDKPNNELIPLRGFTPSSQFPENPLSEPRGEAMNVVVDRIYGQKGILQGEPPSKPKNIIPEISEQDYINKEIIRFFLKKNNEIRYIETNKETFELFKNRSPLVKYQLYTPFSLPWVISGDMNEVFNNNLKNVTEVASRQRLKGFKEYFKDNFLTFYKK
jgi:hypothetical protein